MQKKNIKEKAKAAKAAEIKILEIDPWLMPYRKDIELRMDRYSEVRNTLLGKKEGFRDFANGHKYFGFHRADDGWHYREWAPAANLSTRKNELARYTRNTLRKGTRLNIRISKRDLLEWQRKVVQDIVAVSDLHFKYY